MTQLIIQGTTLDDFLTQVSKTVSETIRAEKAETPIQVKPNYLTRSEVAGRLNISLPTLNEYTKKGLILAYRFGARVLYKESEVDNALTQVLTSKFRK
jgi:excisionase family DNA binding protein